MIELDNERLRFLNEQLAEREAMLSEVQKMKYIELYESLRTKVLSIYSISFEAQSQMREALKYEKKSKTNWNFFLVSTIFLGFLYYLKQGDDVWSVGIAFTQVLLTSYFLLLINETNRAKSLALHSCQLFKSRATDIENNLNFFGERYESSELVRKMINNIKADSSMPFHEFADACEILEIKSQIAEYVWMSC